MWTRAIIVTGFEQQRAFAHAVLKSDFNASSQTLFNRGGEGRETEAASERMVSWPLVSELPSSVFFFFSCLWSLSSRVSYSIVPYLSLLPPFLSPFSFLFCCILLVFIIITNHQDIPSHKSKRIYLKCFIFAGVAKRFGNSKCGATQRPSVRRDRERGGG